jgi:predicted DNA-binding antitoxin AbrB/MazE fold protein
MIQRITAVVEQGRLRPTTPLALTEGAEVQIVIESVTEPPPKPRHDPEKVRRIIAEIAAMPMEPGGEEFSGRDHDRILYGGEGGAR